MRNYLRTLWHSLKAAKCAAITVYRKERALQKTVKLVRRSEYFDADWYLRNNPDVAAAKMDPAYHYAFYGARSGRNPSIFFVNDEYYALHCDVRASRVNPLVHYEKFGKREGREISFLEVKKPTFSKESIEGIWHFEKAPAQKRRIAIVASYFGDGKLSATLIYLLKGLHEVVDNIVLVGDCPVLPEEVKKLEGMVAVAKFERHEQYDFGSYRRGLEICRKEGLLGSCDIDELVVLNDSNYGPLYPLSESFCVMREKKCDFWGYTGYDLSGHKHISSYFYVFRRAIIDSGILDEFLLQVKGRLTRDVVIERFEVCLTQHLAGNGFSWDTYVPFGAVVGNPTKHPLTVVGKYRMPLVKVKTINGDSYDDHRKTMALIEQINPVLYNLITVQPIRRKHYKITYSEHQASFAGKRRAIAEKMQSGKRVRVVFFVTTTSMFPMEPLFVEMCKDSRFEAKICAIPDMRWHDGKVIDAIEACERELAGKYGECMLIHVRPDEFGAWPDVLVDADIVAYPSPYELSVFRYNPHYALGRPFLPICANYGYYRSIYDRHVMSGQSYAYMWKAFFECEATVEEYRKYSAIGGANVDLVGYMKMDALAHVSPRSHSRKRVLIALHHSVEGGTNKMLSLANFIEYADFFKELPGRYPEIDFVFRPHPFLFKVMAHKNEWGEQKVADYIAQIKTRPNVIWSEGGDYFREFVESDACIQDCGSFLVEYFYTGKPCCYMLKSPHDIETKFASFGQECLKNCYLAYNVNEIDEFIRAVVEGGKDPKSKARNKFSKSVKVNYPRAAEVAFQHICEALGV